MSRGTKPGTHSQLCTNAIADVTARCFLRPEEKRPGEGGPAAGETDAEEQPAQAPPPDPASTRAAAPA